MTVTNAFRATLDQIVAAVGDLPAAPAVMSSAMKLTSNTESKIADISKVLSSDQSISAKAMKLANSPFYGRKRQVKTLEEAILVLGFDEVRSIIMAASAQKMFASDDPDGPESKLWRHSFGTAVAARQIARWLGHPDEGEVYVAGLLHDIGKLVLLQNLKDRYMEVVTQVEAETGSFRILEQQALHFNHCDVASMLLSKWSFPSDLVQALTSHHRPPTFRAGTTAPIAHVVSLASDISKHLDVGFADERIDPLFRHPSAIILNLGHEATEELLLETYTIYHSEMSLFESP
ncbi:MAG: HDOD domain-containing protein [candidate division Zixibacteria bacterium]|nr:HDOD domain-containing protein [candidate division Zixibacteria bacterium]